MMRVTRGLPRRGDILIQPQAELLLGFAMPNSARSDYDAVRVRLAQPARPSLGMPQYPLNSAYKLGLRAGTLVRQRLDPDQSHYPVGAAIQAAKARLQAPRVHDPTSGTGSRRV